MSRPQTAPEAGVASLPPLWSTSLYSFGASAISIAVGFAINILIARALGAEGKGSYDLVVATAALLGMLLGFSLPSGVTYVVARGQTNFPGLAFHLTWIALAQSFLAAAVLYALRFTGSAKSFLPAAMGDWLIAAIAGYVFFSGTAGYWRAMLIGRQAIIRANGYDLASRIAHVIFLLAVIGAMTAFGMPVSPAALIIVNLAVIVFTNALMLRALGTPLRTSYGAQGLREVVAYALPCYLSNTAQFLNYRLDVFIVSFFAGLEAVGLYTLAAFLAQSIWLLSNAAATVLLPRVAAAQNARLESAAQTARVTRFAFWISAAAALVLALCAEPLIAWVYGEAFLASLPALLLLLPGVVVFSAANVLASYLAGIGKPRLNLVVSSAGLVVTIVLDLLLIPTRGIAGAAIASSASYATSTALIIRFFMRESGVRLREVLLPTPEDFALLKSLSKSLLQ